MRPVAFMDNYNWSRPHILHGTLTGFGLRPDKTMQLIAADNIGAIAAIIFVSPYSGLRTREQRL